MNISNEPISFKHSTTPIHTPFGALSQYGSSPEKVARLEKQARLKVQSVRLHTALTELRNEREQYYRRVIYCMATLRVTGTGGLVTHRCNGRLCQNCNNIRAGKTFNKYFPVISTFKEPCFVTLTLLPVEKHYLSNRIKTLIKVFNLISNCLRKQGITIHALRKIEIGWSCEGDNYRPHFHILLEGRAVAEKIIRQWLKRFPKKADSKGQDYFRIQSIEELRTMLLYMTKPVTTMNANSLEANDMIVRALFKKKSVQAFGALLGKKSRLLSQRNRIGLDITLAHGRKNTESVNTNHREGSNYESRKDTTLNNKVDQFGYKWSQTLSTWLNTKTGQCIFFSRLFSINARIARLQ